MVVIAPSMLTWRTELWRARMMSLGMPVPAIDLTWNGA
jgi:hypothetical protein